MTSIVVACALLLSFAAPPAFAQELTISVAISMKDAIEEVGRRFVAEQRGATLRYNFGSSGELQKQVEAGAPVDVVVFAGARQMDELEARGLLLSGSRRAFARTVLTVIKPADSTLDLAKPADFLDPRVKRIVVGNPRTVPAGQYAEESLRALGLWERVRDKLVYAENVRQALEYVARGEADAGCVYVPDARARADRVREAFRLPEDTYRPVVYPAAVVRDTRRPALARAFVDRLAGADTRTVLQRFGFDPPPPGSR
ncbi:MAG TPA: molybdate ABC transporter substrate-binding protein [Methylomirabilota bacterium]|jgi:molybdate transport system substrate-binding protein